MKIAISETIYEIWQFRNDICFDRNIDNTNIVSKIIDNIVYRGWMQPKLKGYIANMML